MGATILESEYREPTVSAGLTLYGGTGLRGEKGERGGKGGKGGSYMVILIRP